MMQLVGLVTDDPLRIREPVIHADAERVPFKDMGMPPSEITIAEVLAARPGGKLSHESTAHTG
ncbi:MAG: hypothetical protein U5K56_17745 [Halioglobus sp.]|nr:hypothetical protein [Halioglobus sp.]